MTELENNLTQILNEKSTKIIPENIKKDVTIFNVTGTLESSENLQEQLDAQDTIIEELQTELENKARSKYQLYFDMSLETPNTEMCRFITEVAPDSINLGERTSTKSMFAYWSNLSTVPLFDTSKVIDMTYMFRSCRSIKTIPLFNTSNVESMYGMFTSCECFETMPQLDTSSVTNMQNMFQNCTSLSDESLNNILAMCKNATSYTSTKTLKYLGLNSTQATKCTTLSNYSAFTSAGWTTGY